ncbi:hypothetical protein RFI_28235 [Reticulomyxa filosa]|uniref:C3H1-type domain-containing protein n=1 Tax=Reticulomyxa filosa TaxID=46433 RepID=X6M594_RETFI|nr:hypothetical protein RFI_28235 [Reticulomyxa filosa]|eukprot:ETO09153.1 hypothetical protein RFI_28235 [Reticulomyxa filosa]
MSLGSTSSSSKVSTLLCPTPISSSDDHSNDYDYDHDSVSVNVNVNINVNMNDDGPKMKASDRISSKPLSSLDPRSGISDADMSRYFRMSFAMVNDPLASEKTRTVLPSSSAHQLIIQPSDASLAQSETQPATLQMTEFEDDYATDDDVDSTVHVGVNGNTNTNMNMNMNMNTNTNTNTNLNAGANLSGNLNANANTNTNTNGNDNDNDNDNGNGNGNSNNRSRRQPTCKTWISPFPTRNENLYFFMFRYKVHGCPYRRNCSEKVICELYHHDGEKRRNPVGSVKWLPQSRCANGDKCQYSHTILEQMYHPNIYKTSMCMNYTNPSGNRCKWGYYCTHAHGQHDIRPPVNRRSTNGANPVLSVGYDPSSSSSSVSQRQQSVLIAKADMTGFGDEKQLKDQIQLQRLQQIEGVKALTQKGNERREGQRGEEEEEEEEEEENGNDFAKFVFSKALETIDKNTLKKRSLEMLGQTSSSSYLSNAYHPNANANVNHTQTKVQYQTNAFGHNTNHTNNNANWADSRLSSNHYSLHPGVDDKDANTAAMLLWSGEKEPEFLGQLSRLDAKCDPVGLSDTDNDSELGALLFPVNIAFTPSPPPPTVAPGPSLTYSHKLNAQNKVDLCWNHTSSIKSSHPGQPSRPTKNSHLLIDVKKHTCEGCGNTPQEVMQVLTPLCFFIYLFIYFFLFFRTITLCLRVCAFSLFFLYTFFFIYK